jgi:two-component system phosphate regulon response regulator PhoB
MARIVVIEDEPDIRDVVGFNLEDEGHEVRSSASGKEGLQLVREARPMTDLVVLDLMLPDMSGLDVCRLLKQDAATRDVSILMLTAKGELVDRIVGFELGADDYLTKPFSVRELALRVRAVLRRRKPHDPEVITFGVLRIDRGACTVLVRDLQVDLTPMEFKLLVRLYDERSRVQGRNELLEAVWGLSGEIASRTVDVHMMRLREKLGEAGAYLKTVRGHGYRFDASNERT